MRRDLLIAAEKMFLSEYPLGFKDPGMTEIVKKHKKEKMNETARTMFEKSMFDDVDITMQNIVKIIGQASLVSVFEKVKFRDFAKSIMPNEKAKLVAGLYQQLNGDAEKGFNMVGDVLAPPKLFKWPIVTVIPHYFAPNDMAFVKPTTAKNIIRVFELEDIAYKPTPSYRFYTAYTAHIKAMMAQVDERLKPDMAAFSGFLMYSMEFMEK